MANTWTWSTAVANARDLAENAKKSGKPEGHVLGLAKAITDLCDAVEDLAKKAGVSQGQE